MLAVGDDLEVRFGVDAALEADDEVVDVALEMERVFAGGLLTAAPARILESWLAQKKVSICGDVMDTGRLRLMFGVQKSSPALPTLLNARPSAPTMVAMARMSGSSKAAPMRIGCGKEVAELKLPEGAKLTPGLPATPC